MDFFVTRLKEDKYTQMEQIWMTILKKQLNEVKAHGIPFIEIAFISIYGSQNYNLANQQSDIDSECFIFPSMNDFVFLKSPISFKIHTEYGDIYVKDIRQMFDELRKCSPNILELLSSKYMILNKEYQYYLQAMLMNTDRFAHLSTYKLLKGLEGLLHRYTKSIDMCPKSLVNTFRILQMMEHIIQGQEFSSCLIPDNCTKLFNMKFGEPQVEDYKFMNNEIERVLKIVEHYYCTHELVFNPYIKELINNFQEGIMLKYIHQI